MKNILSYEFFVNEQKGATASPAQISKNGSKMIGATASPAQISKKGPNVTPTKDVQSKGDKSSSTDWLARHKELSHNPERTQAEDYEYHLLRELKDLIKIDKRTNAEEIQYKKILKELEFLKVSQPLHKKLNDISQRSTLSPDGKQLIRTKADELQYQKILNELKLLQKRYGIKDAGDEERARQKKELERARLEKARQE